MTFDYYSVGDSGFLSMVLNGVAMLQASPDMISLGMIGMMIGILFVAFIGVETNEGIPWMKAITGWVMYLIIFSGTATVAINDAYTGQVQLVSGVPFGIAAVGSWISNIGYTVTQDMEQAFSTPHMLKDGFDAPLHQLMLSRDLQLFGPATGSGTVDYSRTLYNYARDCTDPAINTHTINEHDIANADDAMQAWQFNNQTYGTKTYLPGDPAGGAYRTCAEATTAINTYIRSPSSDFMSKLGNELAGLAGLPSSQATNAWSILQGDLNSVLVSGTYDARKYMMNSIIKTYIEEAQLGESPNPTEAIVNSQALQESDLRKAAESSLFMHFAHPMMTFIEGFVFAVTPFMIILIAMGSIGIRMAMNYVKTLFWVQLWLPIMAIINLYINFVAAKRTADLTMSSGIDPISMAGQVLTHAQWADWMATAGMLAAATPALALSLVYGGSIAATNLASRLRSEAPDTSFGAPTPDKIVQVAPTFTADTMTGLHATGAEKMAPKVNIGDALSHIDSHSMSRLESVQNSLASSMGEHAQHSTSAETSYTLGQSLRSAYGASDSNTQGWVKQQTDNLLQGTSWSHNKDMRSAVSEAIGAHIGLGGGIGTAGKLMEAIGVNIGAQARYGHEDHTSEQYQQQLQTVMNRAQNLSGDRGAQASLQKSMAADVSANKATLEREGYSSQQIQSVQSGLTESAGLNEQIGSTSQISSNLGMSASISAVDFGGVARDSMGGIDRRTDEQRVAGMSAVIGLARRDGLAQQAAMYTHQYSDYFDNSQRGRLRAQALGSLSALKDAASMRGADERAISHFEEGVKMLYPAIGGSAPEGFDPQGRLMDLTIPPPPRMMANQYRDAATQLHTDTMAKIEQPGVSGQVQHYLTGATSSVREQGQVWQQDMGNAHAAQAAEMNKHEAPKRAEAETSFNNEDHLSSVKEIFGGDTMTKIEGGE